MLDVEGGGEERMRTKVFLVKCGNLYPDAGRSCINGTEHLGWYKILFKDTTKVFMKSCGPRVQTE